MAAGSIIQDQQYNTWIRGTLALQFIKEGLEDFINNQATVFHRQILQTLTELPACNNSCTGQDIKRDSRHLKWSMQCEVCNSWLQKLTENQEPDELSPQNCNPQLWPTVPWEVCKIYLPAEYSRCQSVKDADIVAILTLLQKSPYFSKNSRISRHDLVDQMLQVRNVVLNSANCKVKDADLQDYIGKMLEFLQGFNDLSESDDQHIQTAIRKITEIQKRTVQSSFEKNFKFTDLTKQTQAPIEKVTSLQNRLDALKEEHGSQLRHIESQLSSQKKKLKATTETSGSLPIAKRLSQDTGLVEPQQSKQMQSIRGILERIRTLEEKKNKREKGEVVSQPSQEDEEIFQYDENTKQKYSPMPKTHKSGQTTDQHSSLTSKNNESTEQSNLLPSLFPLNQTTSPEKFTQISRPKEQRTPPSSKSQYGDKESRMTAVTILKDQQYNNWIRGTLALQFMKEGLEDFINNQATVFHSQLLQTLTELPVCNNFCTGQDINRDSTHLRWSMQCQVCNSWLQKLTENQEPDELSPQNCYPQLWPTVPWEVCKIYLPAAYSSCKSVKDADLVATLTLLQKCPYFSKNSHISRHDLVDEMLQVRNVVLNSANCKVKDADLQDYIGKMLEFLQGFNDLSESDDQHIQTAIRKITEIQKRTVQSSFEKNFKFTDLTKQTQAPIEKVTSLQNRLDALKEEHGSQLRHIESQLSSQKKKLEATTETSGSLPNTKRLSQDTGLVEPQQSKQMQSIRGILERIRALEEKKNKREKGEVVSQPSQEDKEIFQYDENTKLKYSPVPKTPKSGQTTDQHSSLTSKNNESTELSNLLPNLFPFNQTTSPEKFTQISRTKEQLTSPSSKSQHGDKESRMTAVTVLHDKQFNNWILGTLAALQFMKEGLEDFINNQATVFHSQLLQTLTELPVCNNSCTGQDIKRDSTHLRWSMQCQVCNSWLQKLTENQDPDELSPQNCYPQLWPTVPWEVCKIYLPAGYSSCKSAKDADLVATLTLLQKCPYFSKNSHISRHDLVDEMRQVRNVVRQFANCEVKDTDLQDYIRKMLEFLQGFHDLSASEDQHIQTAIRKITEVNKNTEPGS